WTVSRLSSRRVTTDGIGTTPECSAPMRTRMHQELPRDMTRTMLVAVCAAAALLAGCANSNSNSQSSGSIGPALITPPAPLTPPAAQPTGTQPPATIQTATFGQRYTLPSGIAIEVLQPEPFQPSRTASGADGARAVLITVTVVNESAEPFDFNAFTLGPRAIH